MTPILESKKNDRLFTLLINIHNAKTICAVQNLSISNDFKILASALICTEIGLKQS